MSTITKKQRAELRMKFGGRCANFMRSSARCLLGGRTEIRP